MERVEYTPARLAIIRNLFLGLLLLGFLIYAKPMNRQVLIPFLVIMALVFWPQTIRLLFRSKALIIDEKGITDFTKPLGFIPWNNIKGAQLKTVFMTQSLYLDLTDPNSVVDSLPFIQKALANYGMRRGVGPNLAIGFVTCDPHLIEDSINDHAPGRRVTMQKLEGASSEHPLKVDTPQVPSRVMYSFKNPIVSILILAIIALMVIYFPEMFSAPAVTDKIYSLAFYVLGIPWMLYSSLSYKRVDGDFIITKMFGIEINRFDIQSATRIYKHGYNHLQDYGFQEYIRGDVYMGPWTIQGFAGGKKKVCNISRFNTNIVEVLKYVVGRCRNKVDLDGDAWAKIKGIDWLR